MSGASQLASDKFDVSGPWFGAVKLCGGCFRQHGINL